VTEDTLREGLSLGESSQVGGEAEGLSHREIALNQVHGGSCDLFFLIHSSSPLVEAVVHSSHHIHGGSDFTREDRFLKGRNSSQF